jgi:ribulose-5-phosphate 4-epimerase/fuculose-1-phosphate aldolase
MAANATLASVPDKHWQARVELACAFRWAARLDMHESIANHFSYAVNESGRQFLINPGGRHFSRIRASDLLLIDLDAPDASTSSATDPTAMALHSALHRNHKHARCLLHTHSRYATALACLQDPTLPPIEQNAMRFFERVAVDDGFDGMGLGDEAERVGRLLGDKPILLMGNHGVLVAAESIAQAFDDLYYFERACELYFIARSSGLPLRVVSDEIARKTCQQWLEYPNFARQHFTALLQILDEEEPDYRA